MDWRVTLSAACAELSMTWSTEWFQTKVSNYLSVFRQVWHKNAKELKATLTWNKRIWSRNQLDKVSSRNCLPPFDLQQWTFESVRLHWNQFTQRAHIKHYLVVWISELYLWNIPWDVLLNHTIVTVLLILFLCTMECLVLRMQTGSALYCEQKIIVYKTGMCFSTTVLY